MLFLDPISLILALWGGWLLDRLLGEPRRWHPLVGFGRVAGLLERRLNRRPHWRFISFSLGVLAWCLLLLAPLGLAWWSERTPAQGWLDALLLYMALGGQSLRQHARPIQQALEENGLVRARGLLAGIVSRETGQLDAGQVSAAAVESVLENSNDAVYGPLFWFVIAAGPGALVYRLANTLDAMWGYRTPRFEFFGKFAARLDDLINLPPAWITAILHSLQTRGLGTIAKVWRQGLGWKSPNAGLVMASGAASLGVELGGAAVYHGVAQTRPPLGVGRAPQSGDIGRALQRVEITTLLWLIGITGTLYGLA